MKSKACLLAPFSTVICFFMVTADVGAQRTPVVDTEKSTTSQTISAEELNKLPGKRDFSSLLLSPDPGAGLAPSVLPLNAAGYNTSVTTPPGIHTISFTTPQKDVIEVYLPNQIPAGSSFTATMKLIPGSAAAGQQMNGYSLVIDGQSLKVGNNQFDVTLQGGGAENIRLLLLDPKGKEVGGVEVPVWPAAIPTPVPDIPTSGSSGKLLVIHCPCAGALAPGAYFNIGGRPMQILTSTRGTVVVLNTNDQPGITEIETNVGKETQRSKFRNITLKLSADKLELLKGETTQLHITVSGLERLTTPAKMTIDASGVINMSGGNSQKLAIDPSAVKADGTYTTGNTLTAVSRGTFGVTVVVSVDKEKF